MANNKVVYLVMRYITQADGTSGERIPIGAAMHEDQARKWASIYEKKAGNCLEIDAVLLIEDEDISG